MPNWRLPLFDVVEDSFKASLGSLSDWHCLYTQHLLLSNLECIAFLEHFGLPRENIVIFGKAYSTSTDVLRLHTQLGLDTRDLGQNYDFLEPFDNQIIRGAFMAIEDLVKKGAKKILMIDEGGILIRALSQAELMHDIHISIVELTSRGADQYNLACHRHPIVDVARSNIKKTLEPPIIAASMLDILSQRIGKSVCLDLPIAMIGLGAIGSAVRAGLVSSGYEVNGYDPRALNSSVASCVDAVRASKVVLSSTGRGFGLTDFLLEIEGDKTFVNCGSSDIEFDIWTLRKRSDCFWEHESFENELGKLHGVVNIKTKKGAFSFLNGGFPINFDGSNDPIPEDKIQLTRAILMAGALQAAQLQRPGVYDLSSLVQERLERAF